MENKERSLIRDQSFKLEAGAQRCYHLGLPFCTIDVTEVRRKGVEEVGDKAVEEINQKIRTRGQPAAATGQIWPTACSFFFILNVYGSTCVISYNMPLGSHSLQYLLSKKSLLTPYLN